MKIFKYVTLLHFMFVVSNIAGQVVISADASRKLYIGLENPLTIMINGCPCSSIKATASQGKLRKSGPCRFIYDADSVGIVRFSVYQSDNSKKLASFQYKIDSIPAPVAKVGNIYSGDISKEFLLQQLGIVMRFKVAEDFMISDIGEKVESFTFIVFRNSSLIFIEKNHSNFFTSTENNFIRTLQKGDKVLMIDIKGNINGLVYNLKPLEFTILR